jgi:alkaline phosphatase D
VFRTVTVGELARIHLIDVRSRRARPALEPVMSDPGRSMLGAEQREWLLRELAGGQAGWTLLASPSILTRTWLDGSDEPLRTALLKLKLMDEEGEGPDEDQWDGYPAERARLLAALREVDDAVVLSGDIHVSVAGEVRDESGTVSVELTTPSLTSQNLDEKLGVEQRSAEMKAAEAAFVDAFDHVHWCELASHGYVVIDVDPDRVKADWWHLDTVLERSNGEYLAASFEVPRGEPRLV